jgi:hypothetical protein
LYQTLDGCFCSEPPKLDIIKIYVDTFNSSLLFLIKQYWKECYANMDQSQILKLAFILFNHEDQLNLFGIADSNFSQNARELVKIFIKKTFLNVKTIIESILRDEREKKAYKTTINLLITNGPIDLFKVLNSLFDILKKDNFKIKYTFEQTLYLIK